MTIKKNTIEATEGFKEVTSKFENVSKEEKERLVKEFKDIDGFIGYFRTIRKAGKNYLGLCPFHKERMPSFTVSPIKNIWHCFGCQKSGDSISFAMEYWKINYEDAVDSIYAYIKIEEYMKSLV